MAAAGARRDPEARREAILVAAEVVIAEVGTERATHRAIAARAGVPLGSTTYYFPTRADIVAAALERTTDALQRDLEAWEAALAGGAALPAAVAAFTVAYLREPDRARVETELFLAASRDPALLPLAHRWLTGCREVLERHTDARTADAIALLIDGATLRAVVTGNAEDEGALEDGVARLLAGAS